MSNPGKNPSNAFDQMLDQSKRQFDDLFGPGLAPSSPRQIAATASAATAEPARPVGRPEDSTMSAETAQKLFARFGNGWRHEIVDRQRHDEKVIVTCHLIVDGMDEASAPQQGSAYISRSVAAGTALAGTADGVAFDFAPTDDGGRASGAATEDDAVRQAVGIALIKCMQTI